MLAVCGPIVTIKGTATALYQTLRGKPQGKQPLSLKINADYLSMHKRRGIVLNAKGVDFENWG